MDDHYKEKHENFISGNFGGSCLEICLATQIAPCLILIKWIFFKSENSTKTFITDFCILILILLLFLTVFHQFIIPFIVTFVCIISIFLFFQIKICKKDHIKSFLNEKLKDCDQPRYLTLLRGYLLISTAICILSVDFQVFPRRFVKTEVEGTSLMDAGVGLFVFYGGLVSRQARSSDIHKLNILSTWPLWLLGFARLFTVKSIDYQEHLTEYGVHWNFFMTLALVKTTSDILFHFLKPKSMLCISFLLPILYEIFLDVFYLKQFMFSSNENIMSLLSYNRDEDASTLFYVKKSLIKLVVSNKSGLFSCFGFLAINCIAIHVGKYMIHKKSKDNQVNWDRLKLSFGCLMIGTSMHIIHNLERVYISETSRRLANLSYITWTISDSFITLSTFMLADIIISAYYYSDHFRHIAVNGQSDDILSAIPYNGLLFFLFSNLFTGLINICFQTIYIGDETALLIIIIYMLVLSLIAAILHAYRLKVKFW